MSIKICFDYLCITYHISVYGVTLSIGLKEEAEAPEKEAKAKHQKEWEGSLKSDYWNFVYYKQNFMIG